RPLREPQEARATGAEKASAAAMATFRAREHGQAVLDLLDFLSRYPQHPLAGAAQYWVGEAYYVQHDYRQALVEFQKVLEFGHGKTPEALVKIGLCHLNLRDPNRARQRSEERRVGEEGRCRESSRQFRVSGRRVDVW